MGTYHHEREAKYFLIKDYYDPGEIHLSYCPTDNMWVDVLTKKDRNSEICKHSSRIVGETMMTMWRRKKSNEATIWLEYIQAKM
jgi:hypothetical protein